MEAFREKEVPRQLEDIDTVVAQLDEITASLELAGQEAMVTNTAASLRRITRYCI